PPRPEKAPPPKEAEAKASAPEPVDEAAPAMPEAQATPEEKKPLKSMNEDAIAVFEEEAESAPAPEAGLSTLRLQRARGRIWLDLRDGIDLKALARMKADEARKEVLSAVEEIARFRNLDLTPAELSRISKECADDMLGFGPLEELL